MLIVGYVLSLNLIFLLFQSIRQDLQNMISSFLTSRCARQRAERNGHLMWEVIPAVLKTENDGILVPIGRSNSISPRLLSARDPFPINDRSKIAEASSL